MTRKVDPDLLTEERLLLAIGKLEPSQEDQAVAHELLAANDYPWRSTLELAIAHRVHPMLAHNLENDASFKSRVPSEFQGSLRAVRTAAAMRRALYHHAIDPIMKLLAAENTRLVLMKGAAITETIYPPGTRLLNDFDILINKHDYLRVVSAFAACGFAKVFRAGRSEAQELDSYHQMALTKTLGGSQLTIDLHWLMYPAKRTFCQIDTPSLISRARQIQVGSTPWFVLSAEDILVHYGSQIVNDSLRVDYQRMADIYAVAKSLSSWDSTVDIAVGARAAGATHVALSIAAMLGARVPAWVFNRLWRACTGCNVSSTYLAVPAVAFGGPMMPDAAIPILACLLHTRFRDRISYLLAFAASNWHTSRRRRGVLRSCLHTGRYVSKAAVWSLRLLTTRAA